MRRQQRGGVWVAGVGLMLIAGRASAQRAASDDVAIARAHVTEVAVGEFTRPRTVESVSVEGGDAPTTATAPGGELRGGSADPGATAGPIGPADLARLMLFQLPRLRSCYDQARASRSDLSGRIELRFVVGRDGHVTRASASGMPDAPTVAVCVADLMRNTRFPPPASGTLSFMYPLTFVPPAPVRPAHAPHRAHLDVHGRGSRGAPSLGATVTAMR